jgi:nucleoid-associated protein YgaU
MEKKSWVWMIIAFLATGLLFIGCNKPTDELQRAESALTEARDAGALEYAPDQYKSAESKLNEGKDLMDKYRYSKARDALIEAAQRADLARQAALDAKSKGVVPTAPAPPAPPPVVERPAVVTSHVVVKGECLWWIAEYKKIYDDPFQWPLIYKANRDQIKDPDLIYPDQVFKVPRDATLEEIKEARRSAGAPRPYLTPGYTP